MSGILLPMVHTLNTIGGLAQPVGVDHIASAELKTIEVTSAGGSLNYAIVFVLNAAGGQLPGRVEWRYATEALRNTDFAAFLVQNSDAL